MKRRTGSKGGGVGARKRELSRFSRAIREERRVKRLNQNPKLRKSEKKG